MSQNQQNGERKFHWAKQGENKFLGKEIPRLDGIEKASGTAKYSADINTEGTLYAALLTCNIGHAKIASLDLTPAQNVKGVVVVHPFRQAGDELNWDGELIAAVAAERPEIAQEAVRTIKLQLEELEHFVQDSDLEAAKQSDRASEGREAAKGNVEQALQNAKTVHKGHYGINMITHMCMEPHGSHCERKDGKLVVHLSTQNVSGTGGQFAEPLGVQESDVTVICNYVGGGFGSKFAADEWGLACAQMSKEAGRPVRLMLDRATELKTAGNRPSAFADITIAADAEGKIIAYDSHHWGTNGTRGSTINPTTMPY
ncbi:MAG: xanthine dehydrogenase family protein molybdopterin-binding subunit, partial [Planctomycetaceae bacterium]